MAKAKKKDESAEPTSVVDSVIKGISKIYGNVFHSGEDVVASDVSLISVSPKIDEMIKGGIPEGIVVTMAGKEGSGKTTTALSAAVNAQKMGKVVYYISVEGRISRKDLTGIEGLDLNPQKFRIVESTEEKILTGNDFLDITLQIINQHKGAFIIFDSISAICDEQETAGGVNYQARGASAKLSSTFSRQTAQTVKVNKVVLILIAHMRLNQGQVSYLDEKVADTVKYLTSLQVRIKSFKPWTAGSGEDGEQIGQFVEWEVKKNPLGPPGRKCKSYLRYGMGVDKVAENCIIGEEYGLIEKSGNWYYVDFIDEEEKPKCNGQNQLFDYFRENPSIYAQLETKIKEMNASS